MYIDPIIYLQLTDLQRAWISHEAGLARQWQQDHVQRHPQVQWEEEAAGALRNTGPMPTWRLARA